MKFEIVNGKVKTDDVKLTSRQRLTLNGLSVTDQVKYLLTFSGPNQSGNDFRHLIRRHKNTHTRHMSDSLADKQAGSILNQYNRLFNTDENYSPTQKDKGLWVGVEIEFILPSDGEYEDTYDAVRAVAREINRNKIPRCTVKEDGSVGDDYDNFGVEVCILFNTKYGFRYLEKLCRVLNNLGADIDNTCGLHVHLDFREQNGRTIYSIGKSLAKTLPVLVAMQPEERRDNTYCLPTVSTTTDVQRGARYRAINLCSFQQHGTIEVRLHSGTTNFSKIKNWIELLQAIVKARPTSAVTSFQDFIDKVNLPDRLVEYVERRIKQQNGGEIKLWSDSDWPIESEESEAA